MPYLNPKDDPRNLPLPQEGALLLPVDGEPVVLVLPAVGYYSEAELCELLGCQEVVCQVLPDGFFTNYSVVYDKNQGLCLWLSEPDESYPLLNSIATAMWQESFWGDTPERLRLYHLAGYSLYGPVIIL
jgi:hypothetical protein